MDGATGDGGDLPERPLAGLTAAPSREEGVGVPDWVSGTSCERLDRRDGIGAPIGVTTACTP